MNTGGLQVKAYELRSKTSKELLKVPSGRKTNRFCWNGWFLDVHFCVLKIFFVGCRHRCFVLKFFFCGCFVSVVDRLNRRSFEELDDMKSELAQLRVAKALLVDL